MYQLSKIIAALIVSVVLSGCATSDMSHTSPKNYSINNSIEVKNDFDVVWDRLVKKLASDFFVINNIEKESRLINVSFSSSTPSQFIDCGKTNRTFTNLRGKQFYEYVTADSVNYAITFDKGGAYNAVRKTRLEGRSNVYVAPIRGGTTISVNTKYVWSIKIVYSDLLGRPAGTEEYTHDFTTKQPLDQAETVKGIIYRLRCATNGNLENRILNYAR